MRPLWTPPDSGACVPHGEPAETCPLCHPHRSRVDEPWALLLGLAFLVALALYGRDSWSHELAFDDAVSRAHLARVAQP